jgi:hypothetical protein
MKKKTFGLIRNLNYKFFEYSKQLNDTKNMQNSIDEKIGSS